MTEPPPESLRNAAECQRYVAALLRAVNEGFDNPDLKHTPTEDPSIALLDRMPHDDLRRTAYALTNLLLLVFEDANGDVQAMTRDQFVDGYCRGVEALMGEL